MIECPSSLSRLGLLMAAVLLAAAPAVQAQKIVCWKDKTGKVVGCGDRVPPEFQQNESKTLDNRGIVRGTTVSAEEAAKQKAKAQEQAALKAEEDRRIAEQRRQDSALVNTYTSEKEIDLRRDREVQVIDLQLVQLKAALSKASAAEAATRSRHEAATKSGKPVPPSLNDELARASDEKKRLETRIAEKENDKAAITARYNEQKARYIELRGSSSTSQTAPAAPATKK
jgi:hypothetical protein